MDQESTDTTATPEAAATSTDATEQAQEATQEQRITDPEVLRRELDEARREAANYRTTARDNGERVSALETQLQGIAKALGLESDEPDPAALTTELENVRGQLRTERLQNRFNRIAGSVNADGELTLAYLSHKGQLADLDPDAENFEETLTDRIEAALKANPKLRQGDTPARAGAEFGTGTSGQSTQDMNTLIRGLVPRPRS